MVSTEGPRFQFVFRTTWTERLRCIDVLFLQYLLYTDHVTSRTDLSMSGKTEAFKTLVPPWDDMSLVIFQRLYTTLLPALKSFLQKNITHTGSILGLMVMNYAEGPLYSTGLRKYGCQFTKVCNKIHKTLTKAPSRTLERLAVITKCAVLFWQTYYWIQSTWIF